jgi:hypothetical protein
MRWSSRQGDGWLKLSSPGPEAVHHACGRELMPPPNGIDNPYSNGMKRTPLLPRLATKGERRRNGLSHAESASNRPPTLIRRVTLARSGRSERLVARRVRPRTCRGKWLAAGRRVVGRGWNGRQLARSSIAIVMPAPEERSRRKCPCWAGRPSMSHTRCVVEIRP